MRIAFFHGLESSSVSDKSEYLQEKYDFVYCPTMDYKDKDIYQKTLNEIKDMNLDLLIGSSIGGWMAYCLSRDTGIPTVLFNPAFHSRSVEFITELGNRISTHVVVLGKNDTIINPDISKWYIENIALGNFKICIENNEHRTPIKTFCKYI